MNSSKRNPSGVHKASGAAKRVRRHGDRTSGQPKAPSPPRVDGPAGMSDIPPDALSIILDYARPSNDVHRFGFAAAMCQACKPFRDVVYGVLPVAPFRLENYADYTPHIGGTGSDREPMDCRLGLLNALMKCPKKRNLISELHISRESVLNNDDRVCNHIIKSLRTLLSAKNAFTEVTVLSIDLSADDDPSPRNVPLLNKPTFKRMTATLPGVTSVRFGKCLDPETLLSGDFVKFFRSLQKPLASLSLVNIYGLEDFHVILILSSVGGSLSELEISGGGTEAGYANKLTVDDEFFTTTAKCRQLKALSLSKIAMINVFGSADESDLNNSFLGLLKGTSLKELRLQENHFVAYRGHPVDGEKAFARLLERGGKNIEILEFDSTSRIAGAKALGNLIDLQLREVATSPGTADGEEGGASQSARRIKLRTALLGARTDEGVCYALHNGVTTIGIDFGDVREEWARYWVRGVREYYRAIYDAQPPSGCSFLIGGRYHEL